MQDPLRRYYHLVNDGKLAPDATENLTWRMENLGTTPTLSLVGKATAEMARQRI